MNRARVAAAAAQEELDRPSLDRLHGLLDAGQTNGDLSASYALGFREGLSWGVSQLTKLADATELVDPSAPLLDTLARSLGAWRHASDVSVLSRTEAQALISAIEMAGYRIVKRRGEA